MDIKIDALLKNTEQDLLSRIIKIKTIKNILINNKNIPIQFSIKGDNLYIKGSPLVKNSILLRKDKVLESIKKETGYSFKNII